MQPINTSERKKRMLIFAGLYAASIILLLFIFSAFGVRLSVRERVAGNTPPVALAADGNSDLLAADSILHTGLSALQALDDQYQLLPAGTSADSTIAKALAVSRAELALKKQLDSIEQLSAVYSGAGKSGMYATMINSFRAMLNKRQVLKTYQSSVATLAPATGQQPLLNYSIEMQQKDNEIAKLRAALQGGDFTEQKKAGSSEAVNGENQLLKTAFGDLQKDFDIMKEKYAQVKTENNALATQVVEYRRLANAPAKTEKPAAAADNRVSGMEQKMAAMNADISFAQVDCNLDRADAQQIISNARQRKELLSNSLNTLKNLAASGDDNIQKKAKDRIMRLNRIANALHD
jgi:hypothetical protein